MYYFIICLFEFKAPPGDAPPKNINQDIPDPLVNVKGSFRNLILYYISVV